MAGVGRIKGSKNKPKPIPPEYLRAMELAKAAGYVPDAAPDPEPLPLLALDWREYLTLTKIRSKEGSKLITPSLNDEQEELDRAWEAGDLGQAVRNLLALKPRKIGLTTYFALRFNHRWLTTADPMQLWHLANKKPTAVEIMAMHRTALAGLPPHLRPKLTINQSTRLQREGGATIAVETARVDGGGLRGFSPDWLHIAEFAFCRDADEVRATALGSVATESGGRIFLESTANHVGDVMHEEMKAAKGKTAEVAWQTFFFPWFAHVEYRLPAGSLEPTEDEEKLMELYGLDLEQVAWRRSKIAQIGARKFRREFPATLEDAYSSQAGQWLQADQIEHVGQVEINPSGATYLVPYEEGERYAAGGDCGAGVGGDHTTLVVINVRTLREVAVYRSNTDDPQQGVDAMWHMLRVYGNAMVAIERNNWGIPYLNGLRALRANMYQEVSHETDGERPGEDPRDFVTTTKTRLEVLEGFRGRVISGAISAVDSICYKEMQAARVDQDGQIVIPRTKEGHGDVLMGYALALRCASHVPAPQPIQSSTRAYLERRDAQRRAGGNNADTGGRY